MGITESFVVGAVVEINQTNQRVKLFSVSAIKKKPKHIERTNSRKPEQENTKITIPDE